MNNLSWRAAHLYYGEPWEEFLKQFLYPWIKNHLDPGTEKFFFIRYWEQGPHLRFRFLVSDDRFTGLSNKLEQDYRDYYEKQPSDFSFYGLADGELGKIAEDWFPNNSLQWIDYQPETERYGGEHALKVAETHFMECSKTCLELISDEDDWSYTDSLTAVIQQHLLFLKAVGLVKEEAQLFLHFIFLSWYPRASENWNALSSDEQIEEKKRIVAAFDEQFETQKAQLVPFIETLWTAEVSDYPDILEPYMHQWFDACEKTAKKLKKLYTEGNLEDPGWIRTVKGVQVNEEQAALWAMYSSFVHMTNNRIGVQNKDEAYLAHLISKSLDFVGE